MAEQLIRDANEKKYAYLKASERSEKLLEPLTENEIKNQFRDMVVYDEGRDKYKKVLPRYYKVWCMFMDAIGERRMPETFLVSDKPTSHTFKPVTTKLPSLSQSIKDKNPTVVKKIEELAFPKVFKPEAGIFVVNTQHISEIVNKE